VDSVRNVNLLKRCFWTVLQHKIVEILLEPRVLCFFVLDYPRFLPLTKKECEVRFHNQWLKSKYGYLNVTICKFKCRFCLQEDYYRSVEKQIWVP